MDPQSLLGTVAVMVLLRFLGEPRERLSKVNLKKAAREVREPVFQPSRLLSFQLYDLGGVCLDFSFLSGITMLSDSWELDQKT